METQDRGRCNSDTYSTGQKASVIIFVLDVEGQHRMTADWRFTIHLTLSLSISPLSFLFILSSPAFLSVCLILSVDSGRVVKSRNHTYIVLSHYTSVTCEGRNWEFRFSCLFNFVPVSMHSVNEVKVCLWWVHPAKRGIHTLNLYRFELF